MARNSGWVKVHRSLLDNPIWTGEPFTRGQAWVDLILLANHKDGVAPKGDPVPEGSIATSYAELAKRWGWSIKKVRHYMGTLRGTGMVTLRGTRRGTLLTLVKYDFFQGQGHTEGHTEGHTQGHTEGQPTRIKNNKEERSSRSRSTHKNKSVEEKLAAIDARRKRLEEESE